VTSSESIRAAAIRIRAEHGEPTVLINNAGVGKNGPIIDKPEAQIRQTFDINTISHFLMVQEFLPDMIRNNHGHVVTIASMASFVGLGGSMDYCCSKASALAFYEGLSQELSLWYNAPKVRNSIFHPSWVRTPMIETLISAKERFSQPILAPEAVAVAVVKQILAQRGGQIILPADQFAISLLRAFPAWIQRSMTAAADRELKTVHDWKVKSEAGTKLQST
jgi:short-subunit dehydrogenase